MKVLPVPEVQAMLGGTAPPVLLDVRLPDDFAAGHLPGAKNACVFQVDFPDVVRALVPESGQPVVVYGNDEASHESRVGAEKLERLGYSACADFRGGLRAWIEAGLSVDGAGESGTPPAPLEGAMDIDLAESQVIWIGRNLLNRHWGTVGLTKGQLVFARGRLTGGEFTIDLRHIECQDLKGSPLHDVLVAHLQSDDFFDVERFPEARFVITSARRLQMVQPIAPRYREVRRPESTDALSAVFITINTPSGPPTPGGLNLKVSGTLDLRGQTHPVTFQASAGRTPEGRPAAQATLAIDRTRWGVIYGSGRFFRRLAGHLVNDHIELQIRLVGR